MIIKHAYIEITNCCNLNCRSCYNRSGIPHQKRELSYVDFQILYRRLIEEYSCTRITLSGGEPTLHTEFKDILAFALQNSETEIAVITNGTTDNTFLLRKYHEDPNLMLQISLDGSSEKVNAVTRGVGSFAKTISFLQKLTDDSDKKPIIKMVVSQRNLSDITSFFEFCVNNESVPAFDFINAMGNASDEWDTLALTAEDKLAVLRLINTLNKKYSCNAALPYCTHICPLDNLDSEHSVLIKSDGSVYPCQMLYDDNYRLGSLLTDTTDTITTSFQKIAAIAAARKKTDYGCTRCPAHTYCQKGCMALAEMTAQDPLANDGDCGFRKLQLLGFHVMEQGI